MLQFLGRGSAFSDEQNCAIFEEDGELIIEGEPDDYFDIETAEE